MKWLKMGVSDKLLGTWCLFSYATYFTCICVAGKVDPFDFFKSNDS